MKYIRLALTSLLFGLFFVTTGLAQVQRTFVSGLGNDANPCSRTAACRTLAQALTATNPGGEVIVLDSAGYGPVNITRAVSIIAPPGLYAGISVFSGDGIDIDAGSSDTVILRGLTVNSQGGTNGIVFIGGGALQVESCTINGFSSGIGVAFNGPGLFNMNDSTVRGNLLGVAVASSVNKAYAAIDHVRMHLNKSCGLLEKSGSAVTVRNSVASGNGIGFSAFSNIAVLVELTIESCVASNNDVGIQAQATPVAAVFVKVSDSTVTGNDVGLQNLGSQNRSFLFSRQNNTLSASRTRDTFGEIDVYSPF